MNWYFRLLIALGILIIGWYIISYLMRWIL